MYKQPTNFKMLIFLFVKGREGPGELQGSEREVEKGRWDTDWKRNI